MLVLSHLYFNSLPSSYNDSILQEFGRIQSIHLSPLVLKLHIDYHYHSALVLWNSRLRDLRHVAHHVTPSPVLNSPVYEFSTSLSEQFKNLSLSLFPLSVFRTDISGIDQVSSFISHRPTFRYHSSSFHSHQCLVYFTCKCLGISSH